MAENCCKLPPEHLDEDRDRSFLSEGSGLARAGDRLQAALRAELTRIPGGFFEMGNRKFTHAADFDSPRRRVKLSPFLISPTAVTNLDFARFIDETGYRTVAEQEGWSFVFHLFLKDATAHPITPPGLRWWRKVDGASWCAPEGPASHIVGREEHPVVHIAWYDALAYSRWAGLRLPHEAEWERAARGGLERKKFPSGNAFMPDGQHAMNTWQGNFPDENTADDGSRARLPYGPSGPTVTASTT